MNGKAFILIIVGVLICWKSLAQYPSLHGKFSVDEEKGCAPITIQVTYPGAPGKPPCGGAVSCTAKITKSDGTYRTKTFVAGDTLKFSSADSYNLKIVYQATVVDNDSIMINTTPNIPPNFEAYSCNGNQVKVEVRDPNYAYYIINYNDGSPTPTLPAVAATDIHTYPAPPPSTRNVSVRGFNGANTKDNCMSNTLPVTVAAVLPAANITQVEVLSGTDVKVDFATSPSVQYRFMIGTNTAASFQQYKVIYSPTVTANSETIPSIRPDDNFYCFRVDTYNPCGNNVTASSPVICSTNFDVAAQNNQNNLTWTTAAKSVPHNLTDFTVERDAGALTPNVPFNQFSYIDNNVVCNTLYEYRLVGNYPGNVKSLSLKKTETAFSTDIPPAVTDISSVVEGSGNAVALTWTPSAIPVEEYSLVKAVNGNYNPLATTATPTYTDPTYLTTEPTCYRIAYTDQCNNQSPQSLDACPVQLVGSLQKDNVINLTWTAYSGWAAGVKNYVVEKYDEEGQLLESIDVGTATTYSDNSEDFINQVFLYRIFAYANNATLTESASNVINVIKQPNLFYPTAFTPNLDGLNDNFKVFGQFVAQFEMKIFNRWGELMYITDDLGDPGWDGTYKGHLMPEATYVFTARITDLAGRSFDRSGSVLLLRKSK